MCRLLSRRRRFAVGCNERCAKSGQRSSGRRGATKVLWNCKIDTKGSWLLVQMGHLLAFSLQREGPFLASAGRLLQAAGWLRCHLEFLFCRVLPKTKSNSLERSHWAQVAVDLANSTASSNSLPTDSRANKSLSAFLGRAPTSPQTVHRVASNCVQASKWPPNWIGQ